MRPQPAARALSALVGIALVVVGIVLLAGSDQLLADLHTEAALGWLGVIVGGAVLLSALGRPPPSGRLTASRTG